MEEKNRVALQSCFSTKYIRNAECFSEWDKSSIHNFIPYFDLSNVLSIVRQKIMNRTLSLIKDVV